MAHQKLHSISPKKAKETSDEEKLSRNHKEVEAESVAYTVCQHYGIETSDYSFAYIAGWSQGKETPELKAFLNRIRTAASEMITAIDAQLQVEERKQNRNRKHKVRKKQRQRRRHYDAYSRRNDDDEVL